LCFAPVQCREDVERPGRRSGGKAHRDVLEVLVDVDQPDPNLVIGLRVTVSFLEGA
jgi:hypothetical protein